MTNCGCETEEANQLESRTLWTLLAINGGMFIVEALAGWRADSAGLLGDSLDMLADAAVYGIALYAVGRARRLQWQAARVSGVVEIFLGLGVLVEVIRRFIYGSDPASKMIMAVGTAALIANAFCMMLIAKHRDGGIHMRASWIFSTNDVIANLGVIASGALVMYFESRVPDLIIGTAISAIVLRGGFQILREVKNARLEGVGA